MGALNAEGLKHLSHLAGIACAEGGRELLLQAAEDFGGSHQPSFLLVGWQAEAFVENILNGRLLVEGLQLLGQEAGAEGGFASALLRADE